MNKDKINKKIIEAIKRVYDPEIPVDIYSLGLIYKISIDDNDNSHILMTLTSPSCPAAEIIPVEVQKEVEKIEELKSVTVEITFDPPYQTDMMSEEAKLELGFE